MYRRRESAISDFHATQCVALVFDAVLSDAY